ncbi:MAG: hypothetical protein GY811_23190 [Myxococcales bacterium]|nr:hypothetical protein [Myxococcales bacterium]
MQRPLFIVCSLAITLGGATVMAQPAPEAVPAPPSPPVAPETATAVEAGAPPDSPTTTEPGGEEPSEASTTAVTTPGEPAAPPTPVVESTSPTAVPETGGNDEGVVFSSSRPIGAIPPDLAKGAPEPKAEYRPIASKTWQGMHFDVPLHLGGLVEGNTSFGLDRYGNDSDSPTSLLPLLRVGARFSTLKKLKRIVLRGEYEHDVVAGPSGLRQEMDDEGRLSDTDLSSQLRKAFVIASFDERVWVGAGAMTSSWGLGLLANAGDQYWEPGSARFASPRAGDRVIRGMAIVGLSKKHGAAISVAADSVLGDDILLGEADRLRADLDDIIEDDSAKQVVGALRVGQGKKTSGGMYGAYRDQDSVEGAGLKVLALDVTAKTELDLAGSKLVLEGEVAYITGKTTWAPTLDFDEHDVQQLGLAARASYHHNEDIGAVADFLYASGDQNFDDKSQTGFRTDRNYEMGMLLFRQVLAGQTARSVGTASDLDLTGEPSEDIERFATRGGASNTIAFFPRAYYRPMSGLEVYGGPLFAFTAAKYADPFNSRLAGGTARNSLNGTPGSYLGTELDVGVRYRQMIRGSELTFGIEGGMLMPGSVFEDEMGAGLGSVFGARAMMNYRL